MSCRCLSCWQVTDKSARQLPIVTGAPWPLKKNIPGMIIQQNRLINRKQWDTIWVRNSFLSKVSRRPLEAAARRATDLRREFLMMVWRTECFCVEQNKKQEQTHGIRRKDFSSRLHVIDQFAWITVTLFLLLKLIPSLTCSHNRRPEAHRQNKTSSI